MIIGAPLRGLVSSVMYIRDSITIDDAFLNELNQQIAEKILTSSGTIAICAREIKHAPNYTLRLQNHKVIVVAEEYDAAGGSIDVSGAQGVRGVNGAHGAKGYASATPANCKDGGNGGNGGPGQVGTKGAEVQLYVRRLNRANLLARGGNGGRGGDGGNGGDGASATVIVVDPTGGKYPEQVGTDGGNGGKGGNGTAGAAGGQIVIRYVQRIAGLPTTSVSGGGGGVGGNGGTAGKGGYQSSNGIPGAKGSNAAAGANGQASVQQVSEAALWEQVRAALGGIRCYMWAEQRTRTGVYYMRCFAPGQADATRYSAMASNEFRGVLWLQPQDPTAQAMLSAIAANLTPIGCSRDYYLTPDFPAYEQAFTAYAPMVQNIVNSATSMLQQATNLGYLRSKLTAQVANIQATQTIIESERAEATVSKLQAEGVVQGFNGRLAALQAEIDAKKHELAQARMEIGGQIIGSVFEVIGAVAAVVGAVYTGGASLAALPGLLVAAQDSWGQITTDANGQVKYQDCYLTDWVEWKDGKPEVKPEIKALGGGLEKVVNSVKPAVNATLDLIDKAKVLGDIGNGKVDGELENELKRLLQRKAELEFERAQAKLGVKQAELHLVTIDLKAQQAQADLAATQDLLATLNTDNKQLGRITAMLMRRAQDYMSFLLQFQFWASRALDIYTLKDHTSQLRFDVGFIHPDIEEDAYVKLARGDSSKALNLMEAYLNTWSQLPQVIVLRNEYESYRMDLLTQSQFWSFTGSHPVLQQLRQTGNAEFEVALDEIYSGRYECKIEGTTLALSGATSTEPLINCVLIHRGESSSIKLNGTVVNHNYPSRGCPLAAVKESSQIETIPFSAPEAFWGRSPAAKWRLYVEPDALSKANLSGLSELTVGFTYKAFIPSLQGVKKKQQPGEVAVR